MRKYWKKTEAEYTSVLIRQSTYTLSIKEHIRKISLTIDKLIQRTNVTPGYIPTPTHTPVPSKLG